MKLDVLAFGAHPDDVELFCGGTVCLLTSQGYRVGIVDLTAGELGSRGTPEMRQQEALDAARISGVSVRTNLGLPDGNIENTLDNRIKIIRTVRRHGPSIVLCNAPECRHPDHGAASALVSSSMFYSGLARLRTLDAGEAQQPWRPDYVLHYTQAIPFEPGIVVDVTPVWEQRTQTIRAFASQFHNEDYNPDANEPDTFISNPQFLKSVEARARVQGQRTGVEFGEGFRILSGPVGVSDLPAALGTRPYK